MTITNSAPKIFYDIFNNPDFAFRILIYIIIAVVFFALEKKFPSFFREMNYREYLYRTRHLDDIEINKDIDLQLYNIKSNYNKKHIINNILYAKNCPLIITNTSMEVSKRDNQTLLNITFQNIGKETITAINISISAFEKQLDEEIKIESFEYPKVNILCKEVYKNKISIFIPSIDIEGIDILVNNVEYDNTRSIEYNSKYKNIKRGFVISDNWSTANQYYLQSMVKQYNLQYKSDMIYEPYSGDNYWVCTCGQVNLCNREECILCERIKLDQFEYINQNKIKRLKDEIRKENLKNNVSNVPFEFSSKEQVEKELALLKEIELENKVSKKEALKKEAIIIGCVIIFLLALIILIYSK